MYSKNCTFTSLTERVLSVSCSVVSSSLQPQGIIPTEGLNSGLKHSWQVLYYLSHQGSPRLHHSKCQAGWITSWNQDCWEKYQQPQIGRWYHSNGRKWRGTKEPFDEGERGEWKSWLEIQHSKNEDHVIWSHHIKANRRGKSRSISWPTDLAMKLKDTCSLERKLWQT